MHVKSKQTTEIETYGILAHLFNQLNSPEDIREAIDERHLGAARWTHVQLPQKALAPSPRNPCGS